MEKFKNPAKTKILMFTKSLILVILMIAFSETKAQNNILTTPGSFSIGVNYWASHAGIRTWSNWKPEIVEADFKQLSENGIKVLRVFPLWPDFQPIKQIYSGAGEKKYITIGDAPLPIIGPGSDGMSEEQLQHFKVMADLAQKHNLKLVVGLITGWMSGQLYVPPALEGKNILTDPESLSWQQKFVTTFVSRFKDHEAILAWDFGNECNVMENVKNHYEAYVWSAMISGAIKSADNTRPIVSGMHSLSPSKNATWRIADQAALTDVLTTHPYSLWTPYASHDGINTMRTILHGAAETRMYGDIAGKAALTEETGVMGPMTGGEEEKAAFARTILFSNWANDCRGTFWWCAYDQTKLNFPPYNYASVEQELGLIKEDRTPKPVLQEFKKFSSFIDNLPFKNLPVKKSDAICILTENQDNWAVAYSSYILAKQAGFDFEFQTTGQKLKDAPLYILPSIKGIDAVFSDYWKELLGKVKEGATLYVSLDDAYLPSFAEPFGLEISTNIKRTGTLNFIGKTLKGDSLSFKTSAERKYLFKNIKANVLAKEADGNPAFLEYNYGKGKVYLLTFPLENQLSNNADAFDKGAPAYYQIYKTIAQPLVAARIVTQDNPSIVITEHALSENEKVLVIINYNPEDAKTTLNIKQGWTISKNLYGTIPSEKNIEIKANDALVLTIKK
jgi:endo-1,4-beta-mannosidase